MVRVADLTRAAFINGDLSTVMSPRTVITWAENAHIFGDIAFAFRVTFLNKCDELERALVAEHYQRAFGVELKESAANIVLEAKAMIMAGRGDNSKAKPGAPVDVEPFRRALTGCIRSIAGDAEVEVAFANERPGLAGERVRLPEISKRPTAQELAVTRGLGDSMALRKACHDARIHATMAPQGADARAIFDAVEQARVEAIGALRMSGVAANLTSMLAEKYAKANFSGIERQDDAPIGEAMALIVREKLTGQKPPASAGKVLDLWRDFIEDKTAGEHRQSAFDASTTSKASPASSATC